MCVLAGYPPTWVAFCLVILTYAIALRWRKRLVMLTLAAVVLSGAIAAVQLFPALEASRLKTPEETYGSQPPFGNRLYISFLLPNYFDHNRTTDNNEVGLSQVDYFYLGVPALFGFLWLLRRGLFPGAGAALAIMGVNLFLIADPGGFVLRGIPYVPLAPELIRRINLIAALPIASGLLAASAVSDFLARRRTALPAWLAWLWAVAAIAWAAALLTILQPFTSGVASIVYPAVGLAILACGLCIYRARPSRAVLVVLTLTIFGDYRVFGSNRRFNAITEDADIRWRGDARLGGNSLGGIDDAVYREMLRSPGYRLAIHEGPHATDMRHYGLATLQGFDPLLSDRYKSAVEAFEPFKTNRLFDVDPFNEEMLKHFGVRWVMVRREGEMHPKLMGHAAFRRLPGDSFFAVFEYMRAQPAWRFGGTVEMTAWHPERRAFRVRSDAGGAFVLVEQFYPGWHASIDGNAASASLADKAFQSVIVPPGEHTVEFRYSPVSLEIGGVVTTLGLLTLMGLVIWGARRH
jgi:hypothetical protein